MGKELKKTYLPSQIPFMESTSDHVLLSGSFGSGKSRAICEKGFFLSQLYPGNRGLICRKFFKTLKTSTLWTLLNGDPPLPPVIPPEFVLSHHKTDHIITLKTSDPNRPSYIFYCGLDDPDKLGSFVNLGWCGVDEITETDELDWSQLCGRLRYSGVPFHQIFGATNPDTPQHYLYKMFYDKQGNPKDDAQYKCIESNTLQNPFLPDSYKKRLENLVGLYYQRYVLGKWVGFSGQIYDLFNPTTHCPPLFKIPDDWMRIMSMDFGFVHPLVIQWWAICPKDFKLDDQWFFPKGSAVMYREIYQTGLLVEDASDMIVKYSEGEKIKHFYADWDAQGREILSRKFQSTPGWEHLEVTPALKADRDAGIQYCYSQMRVNWTLDIPAPNIFICSQARCHPQDAVLWQKGKPMSTVEEIPFYRRSGVGLKAEDPIKEYDDGCDAMRYGLFSHNGLGEEADIIIDGSVVCGKR
jgi:phage terminase large subunit